MENTQRVQKALDAFDSGYNCSQAVFSAFASELGLDTETALRISACFGGGMRCGEVCGAVTGALMAIGLKDGYILPDDAQGKALVSEKARQLVARFKEKNHTIICREILTHDPSQPEGIQKIREENLFQTVCPKMVADAAAITCELL